LSIILKFFLTYLKAEYRFFLAGGTVRPKEIENPSPDWLSERAWGDILTLESLNAFSGFAEQFKDDIGEYKMIFDSQQPHKYTFCFGDVGCETIKYIDIN
jgi:hypothetical protein